VPRGATPRHLDDDSYLVHRRVPERGGGDCPRVARQAADAKPGCGGALASADLGLKFVGLCGQQSYWSMVEAVSEAEVTSLPPSRTGGCAEDEGKVMRRLRLTVARSGEEARARRDVRDDVKLWLIKFSGPIQGHTSTHEGAALSPYT
jgi:hypothetical protein